MPNLSSQSGIDHEIAKLIELLDIYSEEHYQPFI